MQSLGIRRAWCCWMRNCSVVVVIGGALLLRMTRNVGAQPSRPSANDVVRETNITATAAHRFANIFQMRQIANQQVLVNDGLRR